MAREVLPSLNFDGKLIISMMAAVDCSEVLTKTKSHGANSRVVRTVPLPSNARRSSPILMHPVCEEAERVLQIVGTPVVCKLEAEMKQDFAIANG